MAPKVIVYGFVKDQHGYKAAEKYVLYAQEVSISGMLYVANKFMAENSEVLEVIAVDSRVGLKQEWVKATASNLTEERHMFYDMVKSTGLTLAVR